MKKCPKCKAEIQENARFCLYCMTSFEEKQTIEPPKGSRNRWPSIVAAVLVLAILVCGVFVVILKDILSNFSGGTYSDLQSSSPSYSDSSDQDSPNSKTESSAVSSSPRSSQTQSTSSNNTTVNNTSTVSMPTSSTLTAADPTVVSSTPINAQPQYNYIEATMQNVYPPGHSTISAPEDAIVITKVNYKEESGNYVIPDTIDGKRVGAIMPSAFCDPSVSASVKTVTLPITIRTIWSDAFKDCFNLTDLYIKSGTIEIYEDAFPDPSKRTGKLTIHCKRDCKNFLFYYYRNIAGNYDADYEEWNG